MCCIAHFLNKATPLHLKISSKVAHQTKNVVTNGADRDQNAPERDLLLVNILTILLVIKISKAAKIRNRYNQVPHLTQDTNVKATNLQLATTNESQ